MEAENLLLNESGQRQIVKKVGKVLPHVGIAVLAQALVIKTVPKKLKKIVKQNKERKPCQNFV